MADRIPAAVYVELHPGDGTIVRHDLGCTVTPTSDGWAARLETGHPGLTVGGAATATDALHRLLAHWIATRAGDP